MKALPVLLALMLIPLAGCGGEEPSATDTDVLGSETGANMGETLKSLGTTYATQLEQQEANIETLRLTARTLQDRDLNRLLEKIDDKHVAARGVLEDIQNATVGNARAAESEMDSLMSEVDQLYDQAMDRVAQLQGG
ncbi:MAG: hypothetical protein ACYS0G_11735 [Planctomycetota bacterium]